MKSLVLMRQPKNVMISFRPPSTVIFLMDAGSDHLIGSNRPVNGRKMRNRAITTAWDACWTILQLLELSSTAHAPSSIYPFAPPRMVGSSLAAASSAFPNGLLSSDCSGVDRSLS